MAGISSGLKKLGDSLRQRSTAACYVSYLAAETRSGLLRLKERSTIQSRDSCPLLTFCYNARRRRVFVKLEGDGWFCSNGED